jgi:NTP pyrophosphatase (non-canonical NTP hydrolase)
MMNSQEIVSQYGLDALSAVLHETAIEKGFWDGEYNHDKIGNKLALVHSEVTEVLEAIRKSQGSEKVVEEIADIIIRILDVYAAMRNEEAVLHSLDEVLHNKIEKNKVRPTLHGNLF